MSDIIIPIILVIGILSGPILLIVMVAMDGPFMKDD